MWEPVIVVPARNLQPGVPDALVAANARGGGEDLIGRKPIASPAWLFGLLGMVAGRGLVDLFSAGSSTGMRLTGDFAVYPAASVGGFYFANPESKYFAVGKIDRDQVEDYGRRKGMDLRTVERWLAPNLNYDPDAA